MCKQRILKYSCLKTARMVPRGQLSVNSAQLTFTSRYVRTHFNYFVNHRRCKFGQHWVVFPGVCSMLSCWRLRPTMISWSRNPLKSRFSYIGPRTEPAATRRCSSTFRMTQVWCCLPASNSDSVFTFQMTFEHRKFIHVVVFAQIPTQLKSNASVAKWRLCRVFTQMYRTEQSKCVSNCVMFLIWCCLTIIVCAPNAYNDVVVQLFLQLLSRHRQPTSNNASSRKLHATKTVSCHHDVCCQFCLRCIRCVWSHFYVFAVSNIALLCVVFSEPVTKASTSAAAMLETGDGGQVTDVVQGEEEVSTTAENIVTSDGVAAVYADLNGTPLSLPPGGILLSSNISMALGGANLGGGEMAVQDVEGMMQMFADNPSLLQYNPATGTYILQGQQFTIVDPNSAAANGVTWEQQVPAADPADLNTTWRHGIDQQWYVCFYIDYSCRLVYVDNNQVQRWRTLVWMGHKRVWECVNVTWSVFILACSTQQFSSGIDAITADTNMFICCITLSYVDELFGVGLNVACVFVRFL